MYNIQTYSRVNDYKMIQFIDSHAHLSSLQLWPEIDEILKRAKEAGISSIINICTDPDTLENGLALSKKYPWIHNAAATTPHDVEKEGALYFSQMEAHAKSGFLAAVGETGLDYFYEHSPREIQKEFYIKNLHLALECQLPVVIHCRDAFHDFFEILDAEYRIGSRHGPGVLHCFTGTIAEAKEVIKRGWYLSLSGIVTYKKSETLRDVAKIVPIDQLLIETDAPYLAPQTHRGKRNEPCYLLETAQLIADIKGISLEELANATSDNAKTLFNI